MWPKWNRGISSHSIAGGRGRCNLWAANLSPGASNVTVGTPNVRPTSEARPPPRLCPVNHTVVSLYISCIVVTMSYNARGKGLLVTSSEHLALIWGTPVTILASGTHNGVGIVNLIAVDAIFHTVQVAHISIRVTIADWVPCSINVGTAAGEE